MFGDDGGCQPREGLEGRPRPQLGAELAEADSLHPPNYTSKRGDWSTCEPFSSLAEVNLAYLSFDSFPKPRISPHYKVEATFHLERKFQPNLDHGLGRPKTCAHSPLAESSAQDCGLRC